MKKIQVYISGPITGVKNLNRPAFDEAKELLDEEGYCGIIPLDFEFDREIIEALESDGEDSHHLYMRKCFEELSKCDMMAVLPNWYESKGVKYEMEVCKMLKIPVMVLASDISRVIKVIHY